MQKFTPPPQGLSCQISFLHEPDEKSGILSRFPKASTCSCTLYLPVIHKTYEDFKEAMSYAVQNTRGFGMAYKHAVCTSVQYSVMYKG